MLLTLLIFSSNKHRKGSNSETVKHGNTSLVQILQTSITNHYYISKWFPRNRSSRSFFRKLFLNMFSTKHCFEKSNKNDRLPCSLKRRKLCTRPRSFARAYDAKIVRSREAQCNTQEPPKEDLKIHS